MARYRWGDPSRDFHLERVYEAAIMLALAVKDALHDLFSRCGTVQPSSRHPRWKKKVAGKWFPKVSQANSCMLLSFLAGVPRDAFALYVPNLAQRPSWSNLEVGHES